MALSLQPGFLSEGNQQKHDINVHSIIELYDTLFYNPLCKNIVPQSFFDKSQTIWAILKNSFTFSWAILWIANHHLPFSDTPQPQKASRVNSGRSSGSHSGVATLGLGLLLISQKQKAIFSSSSSTNPNTEQAQEGLSAVWWQEHRLLGEKITRSQTSLRVLTHDF